ncbi:hypothetical protein D8674_030981 [Pyrus ussuriensis x Pyrus communis]|uniref:Uncharacterized protein n=1 Tax=Pyrus ussuriensis x Pyrus communis TaxID=2448454 RepID=A0A5N5F017_9ROSA|nr:hypothetical protein D8674_030981 [Pyrus ussuriensis x Pyrus communis]
MESIDRTQKRKRDKQPNVSGTIVLLLYWLCDHTPIVKPIEGKEKQLANSSEVFGSSIVLVVLHEKIYKEANENLEVKLILHILLCKT